MSIEIERKFLLKNDNWRLDAHGQPIAGIPFRQGYLPAQNGITVRVRLEGADARLTIKGKTEGLSRQEFEYGIPLQDAQQMLDTLCEKPLIEKVRYCRSEQGYIWEIDEFGGDNKGLVVAEIELDSEDEQPPLPDWVGQEVTGDARYFNVNLVKKPFRDW